ncbi:hypothetical protein N9O57_01405 [bacterium]|nr:hypothetical protein [bacterium]
MKICTGLIFTLISLQALGRHSFEPKEKVFEALPVSVEITKINLLKPRNHLRLTGLLKFPDGNQEFREYYKLVKNQKSFELTLLSEDLPGLCADNGFIKLTLKFTSLLDLTSAEFKNISIQGMSYKRAEDCSFTYHSNFIIYRNLY